MIHGVDGCPRLSPGAFAMSMTAPGGAWCWPAAGALPFTTLHGVPLYLHALARPAAARRPTWSSTRATGSAAPSTATSCPPGVRLLTPDEWWAERAPGPVLLHDALCPLAPPDFLRLHGRACGRAPGGLARPPYRPVTDTVKTVLGDQIEGTIDRDRIATVVSPLVLAAAVLAALDGPPPFEDFAAIVALARGHGPVELVRAPSRGASGRRRVLGAPAGERGRDEPSAQSPAAVSGGPERAELPQELDRLAQHRRREAP